MKEIVIVPSENIKNKKNFKVNGSVDNQVTCEHKSTINIGQSQSFANFACKF